MIKQSEVVAALTEMLLVQVRFEKLPARPRRPLRHASMASSPMVRRFPFPDTCCLPHILTCDMVIMLSCTHPTDLTWQD